MKEKKLLKFKKEEEERKWNQSAGLQNLQSLRQLKKQQRKYTCLQEKSVRICSYNNFKFNLKNTHKLKFIYSNKKEKHPRKPQQHFHSDAHNGRMDLFGFLDECIFLLDLIDVLIYTQLKMTG